MTTPSRRPRARRAGLAAIVAAALLASSCGQREPIYPVRGKVLYQGQPAVGAKVTFHPKNHPDLQAVRPIGIVTADGTFTLSSKGQDDGAPAGDYAVTVVWPAQTPRGNGQVVRESFHDRLRGKYSDPDRTVLQARVNQGDNQLPAFELP